MDTKMTVTNPDYIEVKLEITMTLYNWKRLDDQLASAYPAWDLSKAIREMIAKSQSTFYPDEK